jgi:hypothetical protein
MAKSCSSGNRGIRTPTSRWEIWFTVKRAKPYAPYAHVLKGRLLIRMYRSLQAFCFPKPTDDSFSRDPDLLFIFYVSPTRFELVLSNWEFDVLAAILWGDFMGKCPKSNQLFRQAGETFPWGEGCGLSTSSRKRRLLRDYMPVSILRIMPKSSRPDSNRCD